MGDGLGKSNDKLTLKLLDGFWLARMIEVTTGTVLLMAYVSPAVKFPLPMPGPPRLAAEELIMLSLSITSRRISLSPSNVSTDTVYVEPMLLMLVIVAPPGIFDFNKKSVLSTPVTISEKVTVKLTIAKLVGLGVCQ